MITICSLNRNFYKTIEKREGIGCLSFAIAIICGVLAYQLSSKSMYYAFFSAGSAIGVIDTTFLYYSYKKRLQTKSLKECTTAVLPPYPDKETSYLDNLGCINDEDLEKLNLEFDKKFPSDYYNRNPFHESWFETYTLPLSQKLLSPYPRNSIFALGESPAWLLRIGERTQPNPNRLRHVAFSKDWFGIIDNGQEFTVNFEGRSSDLRFGKALRGKITATTQLQRVNRSAPNPEQLGHYRRYLQSIGCDPRYIMANTESTVIIDFVQRGGGIRSFLEVLFNWGEELGIAKESMRQKLILNLLYVEGHVRQLVADQSTTSYETYLQANFRQFASTIECTGITDVEDMTIGSLFGKTHTSRRLVRRCGCDQWNAELRSSFPPEYRETRPEDCDAKLTYLKIVKFFRKKAESEPKSD